MAILLNVFCGLLFFIASFRTTPKTDTAFFKVIFALPVEVYVAVTVILITLGYFLFPYLQKFYCWIKGYKNESIIRY